MVNLKYTNDNGESITIGYSPPFWLIDKDGFSNVNNEINSSKSIYQDGETENSSTLSSRYITVQGEYLVTNIQEGRNKLIRVFNPKLKGILTYNEGTFSKTIECRPESSPFITKLQGATFSFIINLYCPNPYWRDISISDEEMVTWTGGMTFPLSLPTEFAMAGERIINIINNGDVATPITLEISGTATNPKITNTLTGEYIKVNRTLVDGDTLIITTEFANKRVEQNGINVFNYIDLNSTFFSLNPGDNVIELTTDDINDNATIRINYRNRYLGV